MAKHLQTTEAIRDEINLISFPGIFSVLVLGADLGVLTERKMRAMLGTIFDALLGLRDQATQTKKALSKACSRALWGDSRLQI